MEPITQPQTGNAPMMPRPARKRHVILAVLVILAGVLYLAGNVWLYFRMTKKQTAVPQAIQRFMEQGAQSMATPSPRPTSPGPFACAPDGTCNRYSEEARKQYCSATFADSLCLDSCDDVTKRCNK